MRNYKLSYVLSKISKNLQAKNRARQVRAKGTNNLVTYKDYYINTQQDLNLISKSSDNYGIVKYNMYNNNVYPCMYVIDDLKNMIKNRKGHEIISYERRQLHNAKMYYYHSNNGSWLELYMAKIHDGSKVYDVAPVNAQKVSDIVQDIYKDLLKIESNSSTNQSWKLIKGLITAKLIQNDIKPTFNNIVKYYIANKKAVPLKD